MPSARSSYGQGNALSMNLGREGVDLGPRPDFWGDLARMRAMFTPRPVASAAAPASGGGGGESAAPYMSYDIAPRSQPQGTGSSWNSSQRFVKNIWGGPQVMGGNVETNAGPGAVYGGYWATPSAPVSLANTGSAHPRAFDDEIGQPAQDPTMRSMTLNSLLGPSLADKQRSEGEEIDSRNPSPYTFPAGQARSFTPARGR